jgi:hypothetical protein
MSRWIDRRRPHAGQRQRRDPCARERVSCARSRPTVALAFLLLLAVPSVICAQQDVSDASRVKAAFLFRFPGFVEWPSAAIEGRTFLDICVLGSTPVGTLLDELVEGESLGGRVLRVRIVSRNGLDACHVLFLPEGARGRGAALKAVADRPVLTVSDASGFLDEGGIIQFRVSDERVRFEISLAAAERAGLRLSAQLLRLATRVVGSTQ